jgi:hypothetical protein
VRYTFKCPPDFPYGLLISTTPAWKRSGVEEAICITSARRSGTRVSLLVLAILTLRSLLCYLPHSTAPRDTCVWPSCPAKGRILEQEGAIGHTMMVCTVGLSQWSFADLWGSVAALD